ncbi:putative deacylase [Rheinheimera pacifica]|uniref:M14 family metallopeptidase n=1 Tax=Rheinheimera pacifica TaxID=173990 RepID=UPI002169C867|nr:M14 family metallopeptidase [Rheinheimera pacifica]MCS4306320.1 putative deacylase [Rheinheimera pacifica]
MLSEQIFRNLCKGLAAALCVFSMHSVAKDAFELVGVSTSAGEKQSYVAQEGDIKLPVTVINGLAEGPVLLLAAGTHGDEFPAMFALQKLAQELNPQELKGTVVIIHLANLDGFHAHRLALNPKDEKNLNREFPGSKTGTATEQIAELLTREFISRIDFFIDMHSGSSNQKLLDHVYSPFVGDKKLDEMTFKFAKATGMKHIIMYGDRPRDPNNSISFPNTAMTRGKPALTTEIGHLGQRDNASIDYALTVARNALYFLAMVPGKAEPNEEVIIYKTIDYVNSEFDGFFTPLVTIGDSVKKGTVVGQVTDYFGNPVQTLQSASVGTVLMINETPPVKSGESAVAIGVVK